MCFYKKCTRILYLGKSLKCGGDLLVGGTIVLKHTVVEFFVGHHIEISRTGKTEDDSFLLAGLLTFLCNVKRNLDGMAAFYGLLLFRA